MPDTTDTNPPAEPMAYRGTPEELAADLRDDPDDFDARPIANTESQRPAEDRLVDALTPQVPEGPDLDAFEEGEAAEHLDAWTIEDLDGATWAARKLHRLNRRRADLKRLRDDQKARLEAWYESETKRMDADARFFAGRLEGFHQAAIADNPKAKTIKLPDGTTLTSLAGKLAVEIVNVDELIAWAEEHELAEELLAFPAPQPKKVELAARFKTKAEAETEPGEYPAVDSETGEIIPGVTIVRKARTYAVKGPADDEGREEA